MKERLFSEYREAKEKDYDELLKIKSDLQVKLIKNIFIWLMVVLSYVIAIIIILNIVY